jgi:hypothetical protein
MMVGVINYDTYIIYKDGPDRVRDKGFRDCTRISYTKLLFIKNCLLVCYAAWFL